LDEVFIRINGEMHYLWRAVDHEGEVLEVFVTKRRDRKAALRFLKRTMKRYGRPRSIVTDRLRSYGAAMKVLGNLELQEYGHWSNNRDENPHQPVDLHAKLSHCWGAFVSKCDPAETPKPETTPH
jgi:putative transposase